MNSDREILIGKLEEDTKVIAFQSEEDKWGISIRRSDTVSLKESQPVRLEFYKNKQRHRDSFGYNEIEKISEGFRGIANIQDSASAGFEVKDRWTLGENILHIDRTVTVSGDGAGGFLSGITLTPEQKISRSDIDFFAPGMIYGGTDYLTDEAIGGSMIYESGKGEAWIREDRLPVPLFGMYFEDGSSVAILNPDPDGTTTLGDAQDKAIQPLVDERFRFGAIGSQINDGELESGYWFPGSEGEVTYEGSKYPDGQVHKWRLRYHPVKDGFVQNYSIDFHFGKNRSLTEFYDQAWRWAWDTLDPVIEFHDIDQARRSLIDMLAEQVAIKGNQTGIPHFQSSVQGRNVNNDLALMGFTGKNIEAANFLLQEALNDSSPRSDRLRKLGEGIIESFTRIGMSPPEGDGFNIETGTPVVPAHRADIIYLRSFSDGFKSLMQAIQREAEHNIEHPEWLSWAQGFGDWLLTQQYADGGFPRAWRPKTGEVADSSANSSYNPIPFLVFLSQETGKRKYSDAAAQAGEFTWNQTQEAGKFFIGGTIDNPDVIDKEAGTLSLEAYLALYEETEEQKWLKRAERAGSFAETWIYIWNIPMPEEAENEDLHWKKGIPTTGLQLISSGHSLVDEYMSFDVDEFAKLYRYTEDPHYRDVAQLLLHNTKSMLALPGRTFDLKGPGWQQEHWSLAPFRGYGIHRGWLPWVSTSQLNGIFGLMEFDPDLFEELAQTKPEKKD